MTEDELIEKAAEAADQIDNQWQHGIPSDEQWHHAVARSVLSAVRPHIEAEALRDAADEMDDTDDPDAIYVANGDIDEWLRARADRIERGAEQ